MKRETHIFSNSAHLTTEQMLNYLKRGLTSQEIHDVERHIADCELCSDGLEGLRKLESDASLMNVTFELQKMARKRKVTRRRLFSQLELISVFAVIFLLIFLIVVAVVLFWK